MSNNNPLHRQKGHIAFQAFVGGFRRTTNRKRLRIFIFELDFVRYAKYVQCDEKLQHFKK